jgi:hypothetical protein
MTVSTEGAHMSVATDKPVGATGFETMAVRQEGGVVVAEIAAQLVNLIGPELVAEGVSHSEVQARIRAALTRGFQTRDGEMDLGRVIGELV